MAFGVDEVFELLTFQTFVAIYDEFELNSNSDEF